MKLFLLALSVLPFVWSLKDDTEVMGCKLTPVAGTGSAATGMVACIFGQNSYNQSIFCQVQYSGFTSNVVGINIQKTSGDSPIGQILDFSQAVAGLSPGLLRTGTLSAVVVETTKYIEATVSPVQPLVLATSWPIGAFNSSFNDFSTAILGCFNGEYDCVVSVQTVNNNRGELSCEFVDLTYGAAFDVPLSVNKTIYPNSMGSGFAWVDWWVLDATTPYVNGVWFYAVDYTTISSPIQSSGIYNALDVFPAVTSSPPVVNCDVSGALVYPGLLTGQFLGVSIQGGLDYNLNSFNNLNFLTNCSTEFCYFGVQTANSVIVPELRGQIIAGVSDLIPSIVVILTAMLAVVFGQRQF